MAENSGTIYNVIALGNTGVGKSSLMNMLSGNENEFEVNNNAINYANVIESKVFNAMGENKYPKLRLIDTQGLSDGRGDERDYENIKNIVQKMRELEYIDLFLLCLEGPNPRLSHYVKTTVQLFRDTFPNFLDHTVIIFNKWIEADIEVLNHRKKEYQEIFKKDYQKENIPCYFIDSNFNREIIRYDEEGEPKKTKLPKKLRERYLDEVERLLLHLEAKGCRCDVRNLEAIKEIKKKFIWLKTLIVFLFIIFLSISVRQFLIKKEENDGRYYDRNLKPKPIIEKEETKISYDELYDQTHLFNELGWPACGKMLNTRSFLGHTCSADSEWYLTGLNSKWKGSFSIPSLTNIIGRSSGFKSSDGAKEHACEDFVKKCITSKIIKRKDIEDYLK
jgi:GTPase SAR1 family protein